MNYRKRFKNGAYFHAWLPDGAKRFALGFAVHAMNSQQLAEQVKQTRGLSVTLQLGPAIVSLGRARSLGA